MIREKGRCRVVDSNLLIKSGEVEFVLDVVLVDFAEKFVAAEAAEPTDPRDFFRGAHGDAVRRSLD